MPEVNIGGVNFDRGIENILYADQETQARHLPEHNTLSPSAEGGRAHLDELLDKPTLDRFVESSLHPVLEPREWLAPGRFSQTLSGALTSLTQAAEQSPENARVLNRAVRLLKEESSLRELVAMYRSALYQG